MIDYSTLTIKELAEKFTAVHVDFIKLEGKYQQNIPKRRRIGEEYLEKFASYLSKFTDLQFELLKRSIEDPDNEDIKEHINAINGVLNKIQFLYMVPISQYLSRSYNVFNIRLAAFSIFLGVLLNFFQPYLHPYAKPYLDRLFGIVTVAETTMPSEKMDIKKTYQKKNTTPNASKKIGKH